MKSHISGLRIRRDGWTPERQRLFLENLAVSGSTTKAARAVGLSRASAYALRDHAGGAAFAAAWHAAIRVARAARRETPGATSVPIIRRGRVVAVHTTYSGGIAPAAMPAIRAEVARATQRLFASTLSTSASRARPVETPPQAPRLSTSTARDSGLASGPAVP